MIAKKLELLDRAKNYTITKCDNGGYDIECERSDLAAYMDENSIEYYVTGVYNSGLDWAPINMNELKKLSEFCEFLQREWEKE